MSTETAEIGNEGFLNTTATRLLAGVVGGFVGSLLMGGIMATTNPGTLKVAIPAMYGFGPSPVVGWAFHQWHGVVLGALYVVGVDNFDALREKARTLGVSQAVSDTESLRPFSPFSSCLSGSPPSDSETRLRFPTSPSLRR